MLRALLKGMIIILWPVDTLAWLTQTATGFQGQHTAFIFMIALDRRKRRLTVKVIRMGSTTRCGSPFGTSPRFNSAGAEGVHPPSLLNPTGDTVPRQASLCEQSYIRVTAAGRPETRRTRPQAKPRLSLSEMMST